MKEYKTSERLRLRAKARRDAIKAVGGEAYATMLETERSRRKRWRHENPEKVRAYERKSDRDNGTPYKTWLCARARNRGRKKGLNATVCPGDLIWPSHCPVLGLELNYPTRSGQRKDQPAQPNWPSLDRYNPNKGYVPGNVFVISLRANTLKNNATYEEMLRVARYLSRKSGCVAALDNALQACLDVAPNELS